MDLVAALLLSLAVALLVGLFISRPFSRGNASHDKLIRPAAEESEMRRSALLAERDRVLNALQDLDFDHTLGKIPAEDYPAQRSELLHAGAEALRALDELGGVGAATSAEERLEAAVAARRADAVQAGAGPVAAVVAQAGVRRPPAQVEDDIEALVASRRRSRQEKAAGFCPKCGRPVARSDRFCSRCGATL